MKKREYPQTVYRKKVMKGVFWIAFTLVLFLSLVAIIRVGKANGDPSAKKTLQSQPIEKDNVAVREGAQSFAQNFALDYFDWQNTDEGKKKRLDRLEPYLAKGVDPQAGLGFEGMEWNSSLAKSQVWNVEETGKDSANITLHLQQTLKKAVAVEPDGEDTSKKTDPKKLVQKEETTALSEKYWVVPVKAVGESFVVSNVPYYVAAPKKADWVVPSFDLEEGQIKSKKMQEDVTAFLNTFFKVYSTGTQDELSYYSKGHSIQTMNGILTFQRVKGAIIKKGDSDHDYVVLTTAVFQENQSKAQVIYPYEIHVVKEDRWLVKEIQNR
jgi:hypothetical protein